MGLPRPARLVIATRNPGKLAEFRAGLKGLEADIEILSLADFPAVPEVRETGATYADNARLKAESALHSTGLPALADDSGLEVDALSGAPGLKSARYAGAAADHRTRWGKLLDAMKDVPDAERSARFRCVLALIEPAPVSLTETGLVPSPDDPMAAFGAAVPYNLTFIEGVLEGRIARAPRGSGGFGYDPVFELSGEDRTLAELSPEEKNLQSHRGKALFRLREILASRG